MLTDLLDRLQSDWTTLFPTEQQPSSLAFNVHGAGVGKLVVFVFADHETWPRCVVKIPRSVRDNHSLAHEYWMVAELRKRAGEVVRETLPEPLTSLELCGRRITVEKMLPGEPFSNRLPYGSAFGLRTAGKHLGLIRQWLVDTHRATQPASTALGEEMVAELCLKPIERMKRETDLRSDEVGYLDQLHARSRGLIGHRLSISFAHGDLRPGNILISGSQLRVIDWQLGKMPALPLLDWFEFVFRYYCEAHGMEALTEDACAYRSAFADVFLGADPYARLVAQETLECARAMGIASDRLPWLLGLWLVENTNKYLTFLGERAERGFLYLMTASPNGRQPSFRQLLRRQVYPCLFGQLARNPGRSIFSQSEAAQDGSI